jgi:WD40 repeat protein
LQTGQTVHVLEGHTSRVHAVALTPDGHLAISASKDCTLRVWELDNGREIAAFTGEAAILCCAVAPNGLTIIGGDESGHVHFLELIAEDYTGLTRRRTVR